MTLGALALFFGLTEAAWAALDFDPIFRDLYATQSVVLQANFKGDGVTFDGDGIPVYRARLFGTANSTGNVILHFRRSSWAEVTLNGNKIPLETGMPMEIFSPLEETVAAVTEPGGVFWHFDGVFSAENSFAADKETIWIELSDGTEKRVIRVHLGDVWAVFGSENVQRKFSGGNATVPGFGMSKLPNGLTIPGSPEAPAIVSYIPQAAAPTAFPNDAPLLGTQFIAALAHTTPHRPQMAVTVARPATGLDFWEKLGGDNAAPLTGWGGTEPRAIGVRGGVWWEGESIAESNPPPDILPAEENRVSKAANLFRLLQWQRQQRDALDRTLRHLASRLVFDVNAPDASEVTEPQTGKLTFLMVQAQGVFRQPRHFDFVPFATAPFSSWELYRGAQSQMVERWRRPAMRQVIHPGPPSQTEDVGFRAYLIPTLPGADSAAFDNSRWQWDRPTEDLPRFATLATRLAFAATQARLFQKPFAAPNVAAVEWLADGKANVTIPGAKQLDVGGGDEATLEYLTEEAPQWKALANWSVPQALPPPGENGTVIAVRYAGSDKGAKLRVLRAGDGSMAGLLPAFSDYRDVLTRP